MNEQINMKKEQEERDGDAGTNETTASGTAERPDTVSASNPGGSSALGRDAFAALAMDVCRKRRDLDLVYDRDQFAIRDDAKGFRMCLSNAYADYCSADAGRRQEVLAEYTRLLSVKPEVPKSFFEAEERLFPVIHNRWWTDISRLESDTKGGAPHLTRMLTDNLAIGVAYDLPTAVVYLQTDILKTWDIGEEAVFAAAVGNMRKLMTHRLMRGRTATLDEFAAQHGLTVSRVWKTVRPLAGQSAPPKPSTDASRAIVSEMSLDGLGFGHIEGYPGLFAATEDDWFCSSRILVEDWIRVLPVKGEPVAMISHSGLLLVTGTEDRKSLVRMAELTKGLRGRGHAVSATPIRLSTVGWKTYLPSPGHPAQAAFQRLRSEEIVSLYNRQQGILQGLPSVAEYVPGCFLGGEVDAFIGTVTTWAKDAEPLLPKADCVAFASVDLERNAVVHLVPPVPWDAVRSIVGHRMEPTEYSPPRYRTRGFPSEEELARLRKAAQRGGFPMPRNADRACPPRAL